MQSRRAHNIELSRAVVIFDEAHNLVRRVKILFYTVAFFCLYGKLEYFAPRYSHGN